MSVATFIGDEVSAAAYRLCGVDVRIADSNNVAVLINEACARASLVLVGSSVARYLDSLEIDSLMARIKPAVLIVPDVRGLHEVPDIASRIHGQLGMLE